MYIRTNEGFGDTPAAAAPPLSRQARPPYLRFLSIDNFDTNKATLKPAQKALVKQFADLVRARLQTMQPIGVVRLVGHTDWTGDDNFNQGLGDRRAEAVRQELFVQLAGMLNRVAIDVERSPGKAKPTADNRTSAGRAANRRVDIFIEGPIPPAPAWPGTPPPPPPPWPPTPPDPDKGEIWDQFRFRRGIPSRILNGKSPEDFLLDVCRPIFGGLCKDMVGKAIEKGCEGIESLFSRFGGSISEAQKGEIRRQCREFMSKPVK